MNILEALDDQKLFRRHMEPLDTWSPWGVFLSAIFGLGVSAADTQLFHECTGRTTAPSRQVREAWMVVGRRGGKSRITALIATFLAAFFDYTRYLAPGEMGLVTVLASDRQQAQVILRYIRAYIEDTPLLAGMVVKSGAESIELNNRIEIRVTSSTIRAPRGYTVVAALCDEIAYWRSDESANPDTEVLTALRPAMSTIPTAMLICLSSPYARRGALYTAYRDHFGQDSDDVLVWQAPTWTMNPVIDREFLDREKARDPVGFASEYAAEFQSSIQAFLSEQDIDAAIVPGRRELPFASHRYVAFCDPSGGRHDSMCLSIAHRDDDGRVIQDRLATATAPFTPSVVVEEFARILKSYGLPACTGDRFAAEWVCGAFAEHGISYVAASKDKSAIYTEALPLFTGGKVQLLDDSKLHTELRLLERRTRSGGKDAIDHPPRSHDDRANATAGSLWLAAQGAREEASAVFPSAWLKAAQQRWLAEPPRGVPMCALGVGVRGYRNPVVAVRHDGWYAKLTVIDSAQVPHGRDLAARILRDRHGDALPICDVTETLGAQAYAHLKENGIQGFAFRGIDESLERTIEKQMSFADVRSCAYWRFREALDPEQPGGSPIALPDDPELIAQLEGVRWDLCSLGIRVQSKDQIEGRLCRDSNRADAVVMAWHRGPRAATHLNEWRPDQRVGPMSSRAQRPVVITRGPRFSRGAR